MYQKEILEFAGMYSPAINKAITILVREQRIRESNGQRKIRNSEIDQILAAAFGMRERTAGELRKNFLKGTEGSVPKKRNDLHFNPCRMKEICKKADTTKESGPVNFDISEEDLDEVLILSNLGSKVSVVLGETIPVNDDIKKQVSECINQLSVIFDWNSDISYWELFFKYLPVLSEQVLGLLLTLPSMSGEYVNELLSHFETVCSSNSVFETKRREQKMKYLLAYEKKLTKLARQKKKGASTKSKNSVFDELSVWYLFFVCANMDLLEKIAKNPIRTQDLIYTYYFCTQLNHEMQEVVYDKINDDIMS